MIPFRVMPHTNSWNLAGWIVEHWWPINKAWVPCTRHYWTRRGARREAHALLVDWIQTHYLQ